MAAKTKREVPGLVEFDGRTRPAKRLAAVIAELSSKFEPRAAAALGAQLRIRQAATMICRLERAQADAASGSAFDPVALARLAALTDEAIAAATPPASRNQRAPVDGRALSAATA